MYYTVFFAKLIKHPHEPAMIWTHYLICIAVFPAVSLRQTFKMPVKGRIEIFPVALSQCQTYAKAYYPFTPASAQ